MVVKRKHGKRGWLMSSQIRGQMQSHSQAGLISRTIWRTANIYPGSAFGRLLRLPLRLIPKGTEIRVMRGPMKGVQWISDSSNATCWMGVYESEKQRAFCKLVGPGQVMFDLGANVGFYTLLASRLVGDGGRVVAFEPAKRNIPYLRRHLAMNRITNCDVIEAAVSSKDGTAFFDVSTLPVTGHVSENRAESDYEVATVTLDDLVNHDAVPGPNVIKCDIEGGEYEALIGARDTLRRCRPVILLATHGAEVHSRCCRLLSDLGYNLKGLTEEKEISATSELVAYPI
jgi:FkbM family methyltransferase